MPNDKLSHPRTQESPATPLRESPNLTPSSPLCFNTSRLKFRYYPLGPCTIWDLLPIGEEEGSYPTLPTFGAPCSRTRNKCKHLSCHYFTLMTIHERPKLGMIQRAVKTDCSHPPTLPPDPIHEANSCARGWKCLRFAELPWSGTHAGQPC